MVSLSWRSGFRRVPFPIFPFRRFIALQRIFNSLLKEPQRFEGPLQRRATSVADFYPYPVVFDCREVGCFEVIGVQIDLLFVELIKLHRFKYSIVDDVNVDNFLQEINLFLSLLNEPTDTRNKKSDNSAFLLQFVNKLKIDRDQRKRHPLSSFRGNCFSLSPSRLMKIHLD